MRAYFQVLFVLVLSLLSACTGAEKLPAECYTPAGCSDPADTESDTDTDADADTDADSDADSDSDADTDADTDADSDSDADTDSGCTEQDWYRDADGDGYGNASIVISDCEAPSGFVADATDCNDSDAGINPDGTEVCNSQDDDCDGSTDEGATDMSTWYADDDGDSYGDSTSTTTACSAPTGYVSNSTDCDDGETTVYPGASETCNSTDDDCDGSTDEGAVDMTRWYADDDGDNFGDSSVSTTACSAPSGYVSNASDCDDSDAGINPGETEVVYDGIDNDCDSSTVDDDIDGDSYLFADDCDDNDASVYPGASEITDDGIDQDCDGSDEVTPVSTCDPLTEYDNIPFQDIKNRSVDYSVGEFVDVGFRPQYLDGEPVTEMDCRDSATCQQVYVYTDGRCGSVLEDSNPIWVPSTMPDTEDPSYNGLAWSVQPTTGNIVEFNYLASCGDGSYSAYVLPDGGAYLDSCDNALNAETDTSPTYNGAFGQSHYSVTQVMRESEVTAGMNRPGVIDLPYNRLNYGTDGWRWPASSADSYASSLYSGAISCLQAGSVVVFGDWTDSDGDSVIDVGEVSAFDCNTLTSDAAYTQCVPCSGYGCVAADDSYGTDEVQIPMEVAAIDAFTSEFGVDVTNAYLYEGDGSATADYVDEMYDLFENHLYCLNNPETAWTQ